MGEDTNVEVFDIPEARGLSKITVFFRNWEPGRGQVTIVCYGSAWTYYFGAMGGRTIQQFFAEANTNYLVNKLTDYQFQKRSKQHCEHLEKVVNAIKYARDVAFPSPDTTTDCGATGELTTPRFGV